MKNPLHLLSSFPPRTLSATRCLALVSLLALSGCGHIGINLDGDDAGVNASQESKDKKTGDTSGDQLQPEPVVPDPSSSEAGTRGGETSPPEKEPSAGDAGSKEGREGTLDASLFHRDASVSAGDASEPEPTTMEPTVAEPAVLEPQVIEPAVGVSDAGPPSQIHLDASTDASVSSSDSGSNGSGTAGDGGLVVNPEPTPLPPITCSPDCQCTDGTTCDLSCTSSPCWPSCGPTATCDVQVGETPTVGINCAEGATCTTSPSTAYSVQYNCEGAGDCYADCGSATTCSLQCVGTGKCVLDCANAGTCSVDCSDASRCFAVHKNTQTLVDFACSADTTVACDATLTACHDTCPTAM